MPALTLLCPAKLNLILRVGPPLTSGERQGYHPLVSWMATLGWGDTLHLDRLGEECASEFHIAFAEDAPVAQRVDWPLERDLAYRAHAALQAEVGRPLPVRAALTKRIPTGAGLGGGSSDAAAMLVGLTHLHDLALSVDDLMQIGLRLGSDVPFLVHALHTGQAGGVVSDLGGSVEGVAMERVPVTVVFPGASCSTAAVYAGFDNLSFDANPHSTWHSAQVLHEVRADAHRPLREHDATRFRNDLTPAARAASPALAEAMDALGSEFSLTGSGSALFRIAGEASDAQRWPQVRTHVAGPALNIQSRGS